MKKKHLLSWKESLSIHLVSLEHMIHFLCVCAFCRGLPNEICQKQLQQALLLRHDIRHQIHTHPHRQFPKHRIIIPNVYLSVSEMTQHFQPNVGLVIEWRHRSQERHVNVLVRKGGVTRRDADHRDLIKAARVAHRRRRQVSELFVRHDHRVHLHGIACGQPLDTTYTNTYHIPSHRTASQRTVMLTAALPKA